MDSLACFYADQHEKAEALFKQCLDKRKIILGTEHPDTIDSMSGLARSY